MNKQELRPGLEFELGGVKWEIFRKEVSYVECITSEAVSMQQFDAEGKNDFAAAGIREWLNKIFLRTLESHGAPKEVFKLFCVDLMADDGQRRYSGDLAVISLLTAHQYRRYREYILPITKAWWTATAQSPGNGKAMFVGTDGILRSYRTSEPLYIRPVCRLDIEKLRDYLEDQEQKEAEGEERRANAVDMMKHIAAAWDIQAEEVFGEEAE